MMRKALGKKTIARLGMGPDRTGVQFRIDIQVQSVDVKVGDIIRFGSWTLRWVIKSSRVYAVFLYQWTSDVCSVRIDVRFRAWMVIVKVGESM